MGLSRLSLAAVAFAVSLGAGCGGGTEASVPPDIDAPSRDAAAEAPSLTVAVDGNGRVTSSPAGIDCPGVCNHSYPSETSVTLTATPGGNDSVFTGWSGGGCSGFGTCTVMIDGAVTVTAIFQKRLNVVAVTRTGNGSGTVTSTPSGIACGATCSAGFDAASNVTLTAAPDAGSTFAGWAGGVCTGANPVCTLLVPGANEAIATDVIATFALEQHALTVTKTGTGTGTVTSTPAAIACGATCTADIDYGTVVQLSATPAMGSSFSGWSGACTGTSACSVPMTTARNVTATFTANGGGLACSTVNTAASCTNAQIAEINLGALNGATCHDQCQIKLGEAGVTTGCWVVAINGNCYCRGGVLNLGGSQPGGTCN